MYFDRLVSTRTERKSVGALCDLLAKANISVYHYENAKWWSRKNRTADARDIDAWDEKSRAWNEQRNRAKTALDERFRKLAKGTGTRKAPVRSGFPYSVLPLSLMMDMLTIENIKMYDHLQKGDTAGLQQARRRSKELAKSIDRSVEDIVRTGDYLPPTESRTF